MLINLILDKFQEGFYFSSGGIGDFLLLLSSIHKKQNNLKTNIVFWADNKEHIQSLVNILKNKDDGIIKSLIYSGFQSKEQYDAIINHKYYLGKCHTPDNLEYVNEWYFNYEKYHKEFNKRTDFIKSFVTSTNINKDNHIIGIGVFGSRKEQHKIKHLTTEEFNQLIQRVQKKYPESLLYIFGSPIDKQEFPIDYEKVNGKNIYDYRLESLQDCIGHMINCNQFYSTDTWYKTLTHFLDIPTTIIETTYVGMDDNNKNEYMQSLFGNNITHDPGNDIFLLHGWEYNFIKKSDIYKI